MYMKKIFKYLLIGLGLVFLVLIINFIVVKKLNRDVLELKSDVPAKQGNYSPYRIPTSFIDNDRFYVKVPLKNGDTILGFCDTGGGLSMILPPTVEKQQLQSKIKTGIRNGLMPVNYILFNDLLSDPHFPTASPLRHFVLRHPFNRVTEPHLVIPPMDDETNFIIESMPGLDAFLGQNFFMGKAWTIDYINKQVWVNTPLYKTELESPNVQKIGLRKNSHGEAIYGHASMSIEIDGEIIDVLFDTGASLVLSESGKKDLQTDAISIGGSFIASSIFDKWRKSHPEWKYYPKADNSSDVIKVPIVKIGSFEVGPVLFSKRPDTNWSKGMIRSMDKVVKGAIGGSALQYFKVMIDYNSELIKLEKPG
jgi:hypothetical protein